MKKILIFLCLLFSVATFAQTSYLQSTKQGQLLTLNIPISLSKAATNYSQSFPLDGYTPFDSTHFFTVAWQSNDTVQVTVALQVMNPQYTSLGSAYAGSWQTVATLATVQANAGNDTLYSFNIFQRGAIAPGVLDAVTMAGKLGTFGRIKVSFANATTVGASGQFRLWAILPKR